MTTTTTEKHILIIANPWYPVFIGGFKSGGGVEVYLDNLTRELLIQGHQVDILCPSDSGIAKHAEDPNLRLLDMGMESKVKRGFDTKLNFGHYGMSLKNINLKEYTHVMMNCQNPTAIKGLVDAFNTQGITSKPMIYSHGLPVGRFDIQNAEKLKERFLGKLHWVGTSKLNSSKWEKYVGVNEHVNLGVPLPEPEVEIGSVLISDHLLYISRLHSEKGIGKWARTAVYNKDLKYTFIGYSANADKKVSTKLKEAEIEVLGDGHDDALLKFMEAVPNIDVRTDLAQDRDAIVRLMGNGSTILCHFSDFESGSLVAAEAFSMGVPIITLDNFDQSIVPHYVDSIKHTVELRDELDTGKILATIHPTGAIINRKGLNMKSLANIVDRIVKYNNDNQVFNPKAIIQVYLDKYSMEANANGILNHSKISY